MKNTKKKFRKVKYGHFKQLCGDSHSPKNPPKQYFICFKMQGERSLLCRLPPHNLITSKNPVAISYKSTRRPSFPNFSSKFIS